MRLHRVFLVIVFAQCSSQPPFVNPDGGVTDATSENPIIPPNDGSTDSSGCTCSADLHQVICGGNVQTTCATDQGCSGAACVPACQASTQNGSTIGCEYYAVDPDAIIQGGCYAAVIANTWGSPVTITVDRGGTSFTNLTDFVRIPTGSGSSLTYSALVNGQLPAGQVAVVFLAATAKGPPQIATNVSCPSGVNPAYTNSDAAFSGSGRGQAFHITTDRPIGAYDMYPYGGGISAIASATLLLPTASWTTNYLGIDSMSPTLDGTPRWLEIVGSADGTTVTLLPTASIASGSNVAAATKGSPTNYTVNKGEVLQLALQSSASETISGSVIQSDKPIGVWGGASALEVPTLQTSYADSGHQQLPPVKALGHDYVFANHRDRYSNAPESPQVMLVGAVAGTTLTYDPSAPTGAPTSLAKGQAVLFKTAGAFEVKSQDDQHPFYMGQFMDGCGVYAGGNEAQDCRGDPEWVNTVPPQEHLTSYVFSTDPTYPETELVVIRQKGESVTLDCTGPITSGWLPAGSTYEYARVALVTGNFAKVGTCDNGLHTMQGTKPFGVTVWGWGSLASGGSTSPTYSQATSYAFPAGMSLQPITSVVVLPTPN
jgi:hypothetical protein